MQFIIFNSTFNTSFGSSFGGALQLKFTSQILIIYAKFLNNTAENGGALNVIDSNIIIAFCSFENNKAISKSGGAILLNNDDGISYNISILYCNFSSNLAKMEGGAIKYDDIKPSLKKNIFVDNQAIYGSNVASYSIKIGFKAFTKNVTTGIFSL